MAWFWWVVAAFALGVAEVFTLDLFFANLVVAALAGAGVAALGGSFTAQALTAAGVAVVMLLLVRPLLLKRLRVQGELQQTGTQAHVGRPARVLARVDDAGGRVKLAGEEWSARSASAAQVFPVGASVRVVAIDGATAVVAPGESAETHENPDPGGTP